MSTEVLYENPLAGPGDLADFRLEGQASLTFVRGRLRLENGAERSSASGTHGNFLLWCEREFPDQIGVSWDFRPLTDAGLAMFWLAAAGPQGEDLFDTRQAPRDGDYPQYHHGDINALHLSYFRRNPTEIGFQTCNLRKSHGFHLVAQGGDPLPSARDAQEAYRLMVRKAGPRLDFSINGLKLFDWVDDGQSWGPVLGGGRIGFRQMAGLIGEYANLRVERLK